MLIVTRHYVYNPRSRFGVLEIPMAAWLTTLRRIAKPPESMSFHVPHVMTGYSYDVRTTRTLPTDPATCITCDAEIENVGERYIDYGGASVVRGVWRHLDTQYPCGLGPVECDRASIRYVASPTRKS